MEQTLQTSKAWLMAIRPKSMLAALMPVLVGSMIAPIPLEEIQWGVVFLAALVAAFLTIATNLINDALDFKNGVDTEERLGPHRGTQNGLLPEKQVLRVGFVFLLLSLLVALPLLDGPLLLILMLVAMLSSYCYTGGPYPLSYNGLGELFIMLFYGLMATMGSYYLQTDLLNADSLVGGIQVGCLCTLLGAINNLRDIREDSKAGKRTLAVRFGLLFGRWEISLLILTLFGLNFYWYLTGSFFAFLLPMTSLLIAFNLLKGIWKHAPSSIYNHYFAESALLLALFSVLLIIGVRIS